MLQQGFNSQQTGSSDSETARRTLNVLTIFIVCFKYVACYNFTPSNWTIAHQTCLSKTASAIRSDPPSNTHRTHWTNYRLVIHFRFTWEDGSLPEVTIAQKLGQGVVKCGILHTNNGEPRLTLNSCDKKIAGYICQYDKSLQMQKLKNNRKCTPYNKTCYTYNCGKRDWTRAQEECISQGGRLASSLDEKTMKYISKKATKHHKKCRRFWINFNNFATKDHDSGDRKVLPWLNDHPKFNKECVVALFEKGKLKYESEDCFNRHSFMCMKNQSSNRLPTRNSKAETLIPTTLKTTILLPPVMTSNISLKQGFIGSTTLLSCVIVSLAAS